MATASTIPITDTPRPVGLSQDRAILLERDIVEFTDRIFDQATTDREFEKLNKETYRLMRYLDGEHWQGGLRRGRNRPVLPSTERCFWDSVGLLTDLALDFQVKLWNKQQEFNEFESLINSLVTHWVYKSGYEAAQYDIILYGLLHTGPCKVQWNARKAGGQGDVDVVPIAPWQWAAIGSGTNPQDSECILYFPVVTKDSLIRDYGRTAMRVECDLDYSSGSLKGQFNRPGHMGRAQWNALPQTLRTVLGQKGGPSASDVMYPMSLKKEFWLNDPSRNETSRTVTVGPADSNGEPRVNWAYRVEPGEMLYPRGRVIITSGGVVLEDQPNPYWHSKKPFPLYRPFRVPWKLMGSLQMKSWVQMNTIIDRVLGGMQDYLDSVIEPTLVAPKGALPPADWDALDPGASGGKIKYNNNAPKAPEFMKKAEFPIAAAKQFIDDVRREFEMASGSSAIQQALSKKQVPGSDSLDTILNSRSLPIRVKSRALASFAEEAGEMVVSNMLQFYTVAHRVNILGKEGISSSDFRPVYAQGIPAGLRPEEFVRKFTGTCKRDTILESQKAEKKQLALALAKLGKLSDRNLFRALDVSFDFDQNKMEMLEEARLKLLVAAAAAAAQGKGMGKKKS